MTVTSRLQVCASRLKDARGRESQESFARRAGLSVATVSRIELGKHMPSVGTAAALAAATGKKTAYFLGDEAEEEESIVRALYAFLTSYKERGPEVVDAINYGRRSIDRRGVAA